MIKVAIDKGPFEGEDVVRGIGFHTAEIVKYLRKSKGVQIDTVDFSTKDLSNYDVVHYPKFNPYLTDLPLLKTTKTVTTIHDLIYLVYPDKYPPGLKGKLRFLINKRFVRNADAIITISNTSKKDIVKYLGVNENKVHVVYLAARDIFKPVNDKKVLERIKVQHNLPEKFVLYVGDVNYNKNLLTLADACKKIGVPLVIVGKQAVSDKSMLDHIETRSLKELLEKYGDDKDIMRIGYVQDDDLVAIFNLASVYCQPSLYEGFGLPILEGFATKTPVVASDIKCHREVAGDAVVYVDPKSAGDMAKGLKKVIMDEKLKEKLIQKGTEQLKKYSWEKTASRTLEVYKRVVG